MNSIAARMFAAMLGVAAIAACTDDEQGTAPAAIREVLPAESGFGLVKLQWKAPLDDPNYYYTLVTYKDHKGDERKTMATRYNADADGITSIEVDGFTKTSAVTFTLTPCNRKGAAGPAITAVGEPWLAAFQLVQPTIEVAIARAGSIVVKWQNNQPVDAFIEIAYTLGGKKITQTITAIRDSARVGDDGQIVDLVDGGMPGGEIEFTIRARDRYKNYADGPKREVIAVVPFNERELDKTLWSVPGGTTGKGPTIGFDSQHSDGTAGDGGIAALFDGDNGTWMHSSWSSPQSTYPHWYIIDLGAEYYLSKVTMVKRPTNTAAQKGYSIYTCPADSSTYNSSMTYPAPTSTTVLPTQWKWQLQGHTDFTMTTAADGQAQEFTLPNRPKARYVAWWFATSDKGSGEYAMVAEVNVYGSAVAEE